MTNKSFCEFIGDCKHAWNESGFKGKCEHLGGTRCVKHQEPLGDYQGFRVTCKSCVKPFYEVKNENI